MEHAPSEFDFPVTPIQRVLRPVRRFLHVEAAGGIVLLACTFVALALANSRWADAYLGFWETDIALAVGRFEVRHTLAYWINDGLMAVFFLLVGLEVKRELVLGELREPRRALLPIVAALGGMLAPAGVYLALDPGDHGRGAWAIPMATDIAFVVGCTAVLGRRVPLSLRVFLLTLAIADDIGAIAVIAVEFAHGIRVGALAFAGAGVLAIVAFGRLGVRSLGVYALLGFGIWCAMFASGVHATLAGVIVGLLTPTSSWVSRDRAAGVFLASGRALSESESPPRELFERVTLVSREALSPLARAEAALHAWVSFVIMPVFALANAGVRFELDQLTHPIALAVALGLLVGKCAGIALACLLAAVSKLAPLPQDVRWPQIVGAGALAGIGFTMALFIASLALEGRELDAAKVGILAGSAVSAVVGLAVLALNGRARDA